MVVKKSMVQTVQLEAEQVNKFRITETNEVVTKVLILLFFTLVIYNLKS